MRKFFGAVALAGAMSFTATAQAQFLIIGNDEKVSFDDGKQVLSAFEMFTVSRQLARPSTGGLLFALQ